MNKIVFFDGECNLCNSMVDFIIHTDKSKTFCFSSLQSPFAINFLKKSKIDIQLNTIYFYSDQQIYDRSEAVKQIFLHLGRYWRIFGILIGLLPKQLSDYFYQKISKNRFKLFGKGSCRIPTKEEKNRFLE